MFYHPITHLHEKKDLWIPETTEEGPLDSSNNRNSLQIGVWKFLMQIQANMLDKDFSSMWSQCGLFFS